MAKTAINAINGESSKAIRNHPKPLRCLLLAKAPTKAAKISQTMISSSGPNVLLPVTFFGVTLPGRVRQHNGWVASMLALDTSPIGASPMAAAPKGFMLVAPFPCSLMQVRRPTRV
jgi:hypothetical protein